MNKNFESYKSTYSQLRPSAEAVERAMDITSEKRIKFKPVFKRLAAAVIALAILIGGGLGIKFSPKEIEYANEIGVLIAYGDTSDYFEVSKQDEIKLFYRLYIIPENNKETASKVKKTIRDDLNLVQSYVHEVSDAGAHAIHSRFGIGCYNVLGKQTATLQMIQAGVFALDLDDYSEIKTLKIETGKYGEAYIALVRTDGAPRQGHELVISGDALRDNQERYLDVYGKDNYMGKGYYVTWRPSEELADVVGKNVSFDLSKIKDTIRFTVEFNDGSVKTGSVDLYFDSDGYMHLGK